MMNGKWRSYAAAGLALITCPCHLILVLPLLLTLTAGTALYTFFTRHVLWVYGLSTGLFLLNLTLAVLWWPSKEDATCCQPIQDPGEKSAEISSRPTTPRWEEA